MPSRTRRIGSTSLFFAAVLLALALPTLLRPVARKPTATPADLRLIGDWEPPDALLVGSDGLWVGTIERLVREVAPLPVRTVATASGRSGREPGETPVQESAWVRDYGPIQAETKAGPVWFDANYHHARPVDDGLPARVGGELEVPVLPFPYRLDGGAISSDGRGLCVLTERSLEGLGSELEGSALRRLGCRRTVGIPALDGEPTGHVDLVVQFLSPEVAIVADPRGPGASATARAGMDEAARRLAAAAPVRNDGLRIVRVPVYQHADGRDLSYVNVVSLRRRLVVPSFSDVPPEIEAEAHAALRAAARKPLVTIGADDIGLSGGGIHCLVVGLHTR